MERKSQKVYVAPQCKVIETCVEQLLTAVSGSGSVNQPGQGGSFAKENPWNFDETDEESSSDLYFGEN